VGDYPAQAWSETRFWAFERLDTASPPEGRSPYQRPPPARSPTTRVARRRSPSPLARRTSTVERYERAFDSGELVVGPSLRAAVHALAPSDFALYGAALLWRARARGRRIEIELEELEQVDRAELEAEVARVAEVRGAEAAVVRSD
jgi:hypothetical protein